MTNCRAKLRHAEYYDFQDIQDKLYADSKAGKEFKHLEELITLPQNIKLAYRNLKRTEEAEQRARINEQLKIWLNSRKKS